MNNKVKQVNGYQTKGERKDKYLFLRSQGIGITEARRLRDWKWYSIRGFLCIQFPERSALIKEAVQRHYETWANELSENGKKMMEERKRARVKASRIQQELETKSKNHFREIKKGG